jgi:Family of unknown function (DUF6455)
MQTGNPRSNGKTALPDRQDELFDCRMAMLGLDPAEVARDAAAKLADIRRRCFDCAYREACAVDLKRDPNSPVWETYCPNAGTLIELAETQWQTR